MSMGMGTG